MDPRKSKINGESNDFYCRLRRYQGLKQGKYSVKARKTVYTPFCLGVRFNEITGAGESGGGGGGGGGTTQKDSPSGKASPSTGAAGTAGNMTISILARIKKI